MYLVLHPVELLHGLAGLLSQGHGTRSHRFLKGRGRKKWKIPVDIAPESPFATHAAGLSFPSKSIGMVGGWVEIRWRPPSILPTHNSLSHIILPSIVQWNLDILSWSVNMQAFVQSRIGRQ